MESGLRIVSEASKLRATCALLAPFLYPLVLAVGLSTSGRSPTDYPRLIATGDLSLIRQSIGWACVIAYAFVYIPPALKALRASHYIATSRDWLIVPSGEHIRVQAIEAIDVRNGFWQKYLQVRLKHDVRTVAVTFAKDDLATIRRSLKADPDLRAVRIA